jgi:hypothetical protein
MGIEWEKLKYVVFDSPTPLVSSLPYFERYKLLQQIVPSGIFFPLPPPPLLSLSCPTHANNPADHPIVFFPPHEVCSGRDSLETVSKVSFVFSLALFFFFFFEIVDIF